MAPTTDPSAFEAFMIDLLVALVYFFVCVICFGTDVITWIQSILVFAATRVPFVVCAIAYDIQRANMPRQAPLPPSLDTLEPLPVDNAILDGTETIHADANDEAASIASESEPQTVIVDPPGFEDVLMDVLVTLVYGLVCLICIGGDIVGWIESILVFIVDRVPFVVCATAYDIQCAHLPCQPTLPHVLDTLESLPTDQANLEGPDTINHILSSKRIDEEKLAEATALMPASLKPSPAVRLAATSGTSTCTLLWSSHVVSIKQREQTDRARRMFRDLLVVFEEIDAATCPPHQLERLEKVSGKRGVFPQLFVETSRTAKATPPEAHTIRFISFQQLETAEYFSGFPLRELMRKAKGQEQLSALYLFKDVATYLPFEHTFAGQARETSSILKNTTFVVTIMRASRAEALIKPWHIAVDMNWTHYMFEDAWDFYTAVKLYSLMP